jgi:hypothetical protein
MVMSRDWSSREALENSSETQETGAIAVDLEFGTILRELKRQQVIGHAAPSGCLTAGRSAASRASKASGPSECEGGESAATPC